ncbi:MAG: galactose oxidase-like domain-containing protein [Gammaproteobacteria bacterium]
MRYEIRGRVIDQFTDDGIAGVRVEAWDKDFGLDDYLGSATTIGDGSFSISFDDSAFRDIFFDNWPDFYFKVYCYNELLASTEDSVLWNVKRPQVGVTIKAHHPKPPVCDERHIYLKIERIENYSPVKPQDKVVPPVQYGRDCMRNHGHENGLIPQAEIDARSLPAVVYREYLDSGYLIPKPDKLITADINEPAYMHRVPGTVIYTRPCQRLKIHVWNTDDVSHSLHAHGLRYGIDSDGSWPFGTEAAHHGGRSDAICPGQIWTYTFDVPDNALGAWPFHDHTHHMDMKIDQGLFGGIVVLGPCDRPPRRFRFPWHLLRAVYLDIERLERLPVFIDKRLPEKFEFEEETVVPLAPHIHARRLKDATRQRLLQHLDFLEEFTLKELALPRRIVNTDHVPVFFHVMSNPDAKPVFDTDDIEELGGEAEIVFDTVGDFEYFCRHHPEMTGVVHVVPGGPTPVSVTIVGGPPMAFSPAEITVGVGGTVKWINDSDFHHTVTSKQGAAMATHCINGRGFVGNTPTIAGRSGQRIRWYVFNLDTSPTWHNFHPHAMRWKFGGEYFDIRSMGPAESFVVEAEIPPVLLVTAHEEKAQLPEHRPPGAKLYRLKGDFVFHCHVHHHMMNGMVGLVRARQSLWLTDDMAHEISHRTGLPLDDGSNACPDVDPHPCHGHGTGRWEEMPGAPEKAFMHSVLLPNTQRVLYWGYTGADQSRVWDYSTPAGSYLLPANQPADDPVLGVADSDMWSAEHTVLDTAAGTVLIHGGFSPNKSFSFDPASLTWTRVADTAHDRFYSTTLTLGDGRAATLYGSASKSIEIYTHGAGWAAPIAMPAGMNHHQYYPWTYLLPDGGLFIAGPHDPTHRFDLAAPAAAESFATIHGNRSTGGEKGTSVLLMMRPPDYKPIGYIMGGNPAATQKTAEMIDLSAAAPAWTGLPDMNLARAEQFTATLLPDGRVFIAGGISGGADGGLCEIFDPRNPGAGWVVGPPMKYVRTYHSSFILLTDGSILGGGDPQSGGAPTPHERFFPDYFDMLRPVISAAPAAINYGGNFTINTPNAIDITEVVLLRAGAVTHGFNMSQRGIELVIAGLGAGTLNVEAPPQANLAPPGWYLLFILNASRVPSMGRWVRVTP